MDDNIEDEANESIHDSNEYKTFDQGKDTIKSNIKDSTSNFNKTTKQDNTSPTKSPDIKTESMAHT